eukprot:13547244-Ditylum_brightwellii.AAC.1
MAPLFADDINLDGPTECSVQILSFLVKRGPNIGYFPEPEKSIHICDSPADVEKANAAFAKEGLQVKFHAGYWYVGGFIRTAEKRGGVAETQDCQLGGRSKDAGQFYPALPTDSIRWI